MWRFLLNPGALTSPYRNTWLKRLTGWRAALVIDPGFSLGQRKKRSKSMIRFKRCGNGHHVEFRSRVLCGLRQLLFRGDASNRPVRSFVVVPPQPFGGGTLSLLDRFEYMSL